MEHGYICTWSMGGNWFLRVKCNMSVDSFKAFVYICVPVKFRQYYWRYLPTVLIAKNSSTVVPCILRTLQWRCLVLPLYFFHGFNQNSSKSLTLAMKTKYGGNPEKYNYVFIRAQNIMVYSSHAIHNIRMQFRGKRINYRTQKIVRGFFIVCLNV